MRRGMRIRGNSLVVDPSIMRDTDGGGPPGPAGPLPPPCSTTVTSSCSLPVCPSSPPRVLVVRSTDDTLRRSEVGPAAGRARGPCWRLTVASSVAWLRVLSPVVPLWLLCMVMVMGRLGEWRGASAACCGGGCRGGGWVGGLTLLLCQGGWYDMRPSCCSCVCSCSSMLCVCWGGRGSVWMWGCITSHDVHHNNVSHHECHNKRSLV